MKNILTETLRDVITQAETLRDVNIKVQRMNL